MRFEGSIGRGTLIDYAIDTIRLVLVAEPWAEPLFAFFEGLAFAVGVVFDLVFLEVGDDEVVGVGVAEDESADGGTGVHGAGFGELDSGFGFGF